MSLLKSKLPNWEDNVVKLFSSVFPQITGHEISWSFIDIEEEFNYKVSHPIMHRVSVTFKSKEYKILKSKKKQEKYVQDILEDLKFLFDPAKEYVAVGTHYLMRKSRDDWDESIEIPDWGMMREMLGDLNTFFEESLNYQIAICRFCETEIRFMYCNGDVWVATENDILEQLGLLKTATDSTFEQIYVLKKEN